MALQINKSAPVTYTGSIEIQAPIGTVWGMLSDIERWPTWNPTVTAATLHGELKPGTIFVWKAGPGTVTSQLQAVEPERLIGWTGKTMGIRAVHIWRLETMGDSTKVTSEESWDGLLAHLLKGYSLKTLTQSTTSALELLKTAAESLRQ